jgi:protein O-mannosyl-transferase
MWRDILIGIGLIFVTVVIFLPVRDYRFTQYDDRDDVWGNPHINTGLTWDNFTWDFYAKERANWMPLTRLSNQLDYTLFPPNPKDPEDFKGRHHLVNVYLHALNVLLAFLVLTRLTGSRWASGMVAALFALHPLHIESVAWIVERKDVLSTLFWLLTMGAYAFYVQWPGGRRWLFYGLAILSMALGLMAKPMLVTLPFVLLLMDYWPLRRLGWPRSPGELLEIDEVPTPGGPRSVVAQTSGRDGARPSTRAPVWLVLVEKAPFLVLAVISSVVTYLVQLHGGAMSYSEKLSSYSNQAYVPVAYMVYLGKMFWPSGLACFYPFQDDFPRWWTWAASVGLAAITGLVVSQVRRRPYLAVGWLWYLGTLVPVIGLVKVGLHSVADRYTYVPLIGIFIMVVWGAADLLSRWRQRWIVLGPAAAAALIACAVVTSYQLPFWEDTYTLFRRDIAIVGPTSVAYYNMGDEAILTGRLEEAIGHYKNALKQDPTLAGVLNNIGWAYTKMSQDAVAQARQAKDKTKAEDLLREAERLAALADDNYHESLRIDPKNASTHNNLGLALFDKGKAEEALEEFTQSVTLEDGFAGAHNNRGLVLMRLNRLEEAAQEFRTAIALKPDLALAHRNLGQILIGWGEWKDGRDAYLTALQLNPGWNEVLIPLARLEATCPDEAYRNGPEALRTALRIHAQSPPNVLILDTVAAAYAETDRFDLAVQAEQQAIQVAVDQNDAGAIMVLQEHLRGLQAGQRIRDYPAPRTAAPAPAAGPVTP